MDEVRAEKAVVVRSSIGLSIDGTRITLYDIMDYLKADWPPRLIQDWLDLTDRQIEGALAYIDDNRTRVEAEYAQVLKHAEDTRRYWEERNRERLEQIAKLPPTPGTETIREKLTEWKARLHKDDDSLG